MQIQTESIYQDIGIALKRLLAAPHPPTMTFLIRILLSALLLSAASAYASAVTERLQWYDASNQAAPPPVGDAVWTPAQTTIRRGYETGTLWLRLRVHQNEGDLLYLALRRASVEDVAVYVGPLASAAERGQTMDAAGPPGDLRALSAQDLRDGTLLLPSAGANPGDAMVWVRIRGERLRWFELDVLTQSELAHQAIVEWCITAVHLSFSLLLLLIAVAQFAFTRNTQYRTLAGLALVAALFQLQCSGLLISWLNQDAARFVSLNAAITVALACTSVYACAQVMTTPAFKLRQGHWITRLLGAGLLMAALGFATRRGIFNMGALALMFGALGIFLWESARQWMAHTSWQRGALNLLLTAAFVLLLGINLMSLCSVFFPQVTPAFTPFGRVLNWPLLSACLMFTLLWRQQRAQSAANRRRIASAHKLHEQVGIHFAQQQYLAMLVHEIKTPLTLVQLGTKALTQTEVSSERKSVWEVRMQTAVNSMVQILDNCGQAERYEGGAIAISPALVSAPAILQEVVEQASYVSGALQDRLQLRYESPAAELALYTDASYLQIILNNLVGNALKYSPADTAVHVQVGRQQGTQGMAQLQFAVINQAGQAGLPDPAKVFERYYRAPRASSVSGTGLGLWLSQKLAERLGGKISMTLEAGRVVFWFSLPAHTEAASLQATPNSPNARP